MKVNKTYIFLAVVLAAFSTTSCFDDPGVDILWEGLEVEFQDANLPNGLTQNFIYNSTTQSDQVNLQINLVGTPQSSPITVTVGADAASTAIPGVHYTLPNTTVTIPAGQVTAQIPVTILTGNFAPTEEPDLILTILSSSGAKVSANYGSLTYKIRVVFCSSDLEGIYTVFWETLIVGDGSGGASQTIQGFVIAGFDKIQLTNVGVGVYQISDMSFGMYPGLYEEAIPIGTIIDNCNEITGSPSNADQYGDPFTINGRSENGVITLTWRNTWGDGGTVVLTKN